MYGKYVKNRLNVSNMSPHIFQTLSYDNTAYQPDEYNKKPYLSFAEKLFEEISMSASLDTNHVSIILPEISERKVQTGFHDLIFTIHPFGLPNEIPGKCSNANYALRTAVKQLNLDGSAFLHV